MNTDWKYLCQYFPANLSDLAKGCGAVERWRNIKNGEELLRIILAYAMEDLSLRSTAAWSSQTALELKDTSVLHRLRKAPPLLEKVLAHLLTQRLRAEPAPGPEFRINDATVLSIPGSQGTDWRLHVVYDPAHCRLRRIEITDSQGGERLDRDRPRPGDLVCGDRGLAHARGIHAVTEAGAYLLLRMHWQNIRLQDAQGQPLKLDALLKRAAAGDTGTIVYVPLAQKSPVRGRLLIRPLPTEAASRSRQRLRRNAAKKGRTPNATALRLAVDVAQDPMERANLKERHKYVYERLVAQWNEWNATMLPLNPQSFTDGFTGAQLADHFGVKTPPKPRPEAVGAATQPAR